MAHALLRRAERACIDIRGHALDEHGVKRLRQRNVVCRAERPRAQLAERDARAAARRPRNVQLPGKHDRHDPRRVLLLRSARPRCVECHAIRVCRRVQVCHLRLRAPRLLLPAKADISVND
jgi:hypothetical protein